MKGWKNLNKNLMCKNFKYEIGKKYTHNGTIQMCNSGFHFHTNPFDLFRFYAFDLDNTLVAEIEAGGNIEHCSNKSVCSEITIIRILSHDQIKSLGNMANNLGWGNTGYRNTGHRNTGYSNTGDSNTGHSNTGGWNKCNNSNGFFNTKNPIEIMVFNKPCKASIWENAIKPNFIDFNQKWSDCLCHITKQDIEKLKRLPNFDEAVFKKISGYSLADLSYCEILFRWF